MIRISTIMKLGLVVIDLLIITLSYFTSLIISMGLPLSQTSLDGLLRILPWIFIISVPIFYLCDLYDNWLFSGRPKIIGLIATAVVLSTTGTMGFYYLLPTFAMPRSVSVLNIVVETVFLLGGRLFCLALYFRIHERKRIVIVGEDQVDAWSVAQELMVSDEVHYSVTGIFTLADMEKPDFLRKVKDAHVIGIGASLTRHDKILNLCIQEEKEVLVVPDFRFILMEYSKAQSFEGKLFFYVTPLAIPPVQKTIKRGLDILVSGVLLVLLTPVFVILALAISLTSPGPIFYRQERLGENGRPFELLKFRSMICNAEEETGPVLATVDDPRITKVGNFLRTFRLDELPQLINVLRGEMSLVGPRPEREYFVNQYLEEIPYYRFRMTVKPGITGLAQVRGRYSTSPEDKLRFDLLYISRYSLLQDLSILLNTAKLVFHGLNAEGVDEESSDTAFGGIWLIQHGAALEPEYADSGNGTDNGKSQDSAAQDEFKTTRVRIS